MATNRLGPNFDATMIGTRLEKLISDHARLCAADNEARAARAAAEQEVRNAEAADISEEAAALVAGHAKPTPARTADAEAERDLAVRAAQVAALAVVRSIDAIGADVAEHREEYTAKLATTERAITQSATNALDRLEEELARLQSVRAYSTWLEAPIQGDDLRQPFAGAVFAVVEAVRKVNGEYPDAFTLTSAVREALDPGPAPGARKAPWGLPVGALVDPTMA